MNLTRMVKPEQEFQSSFSFDQWPFSSPHYLARMTSWFKAQLLMVCACLQMAIWWPAWDDTCKWFVCCAMTRPCCPGQWSYRRVCENWNPAVTSARNSITECRQSLWFNKSRSFSVSNFFLLLWDLYSQEPVATVGISPQWRQRVSFCVPALQVFQNESQQCPRNLLFHQITLFCDKGQKVHRLC